MTDPSTFFREVVRGERHWSELEALGIKVRRGPSGAAIHVPAGIPELQVSRDDVVRGLSALRHGDDLRIWAAIVCGVADVDAFVDTDAGQALLDLVWDLSFGKSVSDEEIANATAPG